MMAALQSTVCLHNYIHCANICSLTYTWCLIPKFGSSRVRIIKVRLYYKAELTENSELFDLAVAAS